MKLISRIVLCRFKMASFKQYWKKPFTNYNLNVAFVGRKKNPTSEDYWQSSPPPLLNAVLWIEFKSLLRQAFSFENFCKKKHEELSSFSHQSLLETVPARGKKWIILFLTKGTWLATLSCIFFFFPQDIHMYA